MQRPFLGRACACVKRSPKEFPAGCRRGGQRKAGAGIVVDEFDMVY